MSRLRSLGRLLRRFSSSTPLVSCHLYCSYRRILFLKFSGSKRCAIHCSASLLFTLISSNLVVVDCRYVFHKKKKKGKQSMVVDRKVYGTFDENETNLHVPNQEREQNQPGNRNENRETDLPNICTCFKVLTERTASRTYYCFFSA